MQLAPSRPKKSQVQCWYTCYTSGLSIKTFQQDVGNSGFGVLSLAKLQVHLSLPSRPTSSHLTSMCCAQRAIVEGYEFRRSPAARTSRTLDLVDSRAEPRCIQVESGAVLRERARSRPMKQKCSYWSIRGGRRRLIEYH